MHRTKTGKGKRARGTSGFIQAFLQRETPKTTHLEGEIYANNVQ
jgi:hypothetical protein